MEPLATTETRDIDEHDFTCSHVALVKKLCQEEVVNVVSSSVSRYA